MTEKTSTGIYSGSQLPRTTTEPLLQERAKAFWFTGLSASGKTTIAEIVSKALVDQHFLVKVLDGDDLRSGVNSDLGFDAKDRFENIRRAAEISKLFVQSGIITLNCFITPTQALRKLARSIIGPDDYFEIFIDAPAALCARRDPKGLYEKARSGAINDFPGVNAAFEIPHQPDLIVDTAETGIGASVGQVMNFLLPLIKAG
jgi:adenylylsulfate kinase